MTRHNKDLFFSQVLKQGALLRRSESEWLVWNLYQKIEKINKSQAKSLSYQNLPIPAMWQNTTWGHVFKGSQKLPSY
jgi:hypothetical protein